MANDKDFRVKNGLVVADNIEVGGIVDGRDIAADGVKLDSITAGSEPNVVDSVNSQTGVVVLDADDISDTAASNKFTTSSDISKLAGIESGAEVNNISDANATDLTDTGESTLHYHLSLIHI